MKLRVVAIILLLSLLLFFGFKKFSANKNKEQSTNIEQLNILKYIPKNNKLLFISNLNSFNIVNNNEKDKNPKNQDNFVLIKDSILDYLGIDLGNNKLDDIYNNEIIISTFENKQKLKDDILIVFKIFSCSIFVLCSLFLLAENFLKPKKSNKDNKSIITTTLSFIINVYFYF